MHSNLQIQTLDLGMETTDNMLPIVIVLMATYNGSKYLVEQIESIKNQTYKNWVLVIRDDGSNDDTLSIINEYAEANKNIILVSKKKGTESGACANFSALYTWAKENLNPEYIMFSDQDDIWKPRKIESTFNLMREIEMKFDSPLLVYSDLELINEEGRSLNLYIDVLPEITLNRVIAQNYCFGCTLLLNKKLIELIKEIPTDAENHDYWVALVAVGLGKTLFLKNSEILYRLHSNNVSSQGNSSKSRLKRYTKGFESEVGKLGLRIRMLKTFFEFYHEKLSEENQRMLYDYIISYEKGFINVLMNLKKYKIIRINYVQNVAFLFLIMKFLWNQRQTKPVK